MENYLICSFDIKPPYCFFLAVLHLRLCVCSLMKEHYEYIIFISLDCDGQNQEEDVSTLSRK